MPILDHFIPDIADITPFEAFHTQWAAHIVIDLNERLPEGFLAVPHTHIGDREVDVRTDKFLTSAKKQEIQALYQPEPPVTADVEFPSEFEVFVDYIERGRHITVGVIEIISPANKARSGERDSFVAKCRNLIAKSVSLIMVDICSQPFFNLHNQLLQSLRTTCGFLENQKFPLYCAAYRSTSGNNAKPAVNIWSYPLKVGDVLPQLPLFITSDISVPVNLETTYLEVCKVFRMH
ncbi:DUF4058 family protein [Candidatus Poribacteria bacterium]|nr:DUF4058 family protein [Candidatus Poribacteria bacterium]